MIFLELILTVRNILLVLFLLVLMLPGNSVFVFNRLMSIWKSVTAQLQVKKGSAQKRSRFWKIDMTDFEP